MQVLRNCRCWYDFVFYFTFLITDGDNGPSSSRVVLAKPKLGGFPSSTLDLNKTNSKPGMY